MQPIITFPFIFFFPPSCHRLNDVVLPYLPICEPGDVAILDIIILFVLPCQLPLFEKELLVKERTCSEIWTAAEFTSLLLSACLFVCASFFINLDIVCAPYVTDNTQLDPRAPAASAFYVFLSVTHSHTYAHAGTRTDTHPWCLGILFFNLL